MRAILGLLLCILAMSVATELFMRELDQALLMRKHKEGSKAVKIVAQDPGGAYILSAPSPILPEWKVAFDDQEMAQAARSLGVNFARLEFKKQKTIQRYRLRYRENGETVVCLYDVDSEGAQVKQSARLTQGQRAAAAQKALVCLFSILGLGMVIPLLNPKTS